MVRIEIEGKLPSLNDEISNAKKHWSLYSKHKKKWTDQVHWQARSQYGGPMLSGPLFFILVWNTIEKTVIRGKNKGKNYVKGDPDNQYFAQKYILDGLQGVLFRDDDYYTVRGGILHLSVPAKKNGVTIFVGQGFLAEEIKKNPDLLSEAGNRNLE